jgi:hypothetical protein
MAKSPKWIEFDHEFKGQTYRCRYSVAGSVIMAELPNGRRKSTGTSAVSDLTMARQLVNELLRMP